MTDAVRIQHGHIVVRGSVFVWLNVKTTALWKWKAP